MSIVLDFQSVSLGLFKFESFSFEWSLPSAASYRVTASPFVSPNVTASSSAVTFASTVGYGLTTAGETIVIEALNGSGVVLGVSSNTVSVGNARFVTSGGAPVEGQRFVFHKGEPISNTTFVAAFELATAPTVTPTLPNGLVFGSSSPDGRSHVLTGTPTVQSPPTTFSIVGSNVGSTRLARSIVNIAVDGERILLDLCGTGVTSQMEVGTAIAQQVLRARYPPYPWSTPSLRYTFTSLPGGLEFADASGTARSSPFTPTDASSTLILRGTPTLDGARQFANLNLTSAEVLVTATRTIQPLISNSESFTFSFAETVLFDDRTFDILYSGIPLDPSRNFVRAQTFFGGANGGIASIISPDLRSDLSLNFVASEGRAYLTGTPITIASNNFTLQATNSNAIVGTGVVSVVVAEDVVTLTPPTDLCYNFVLSRPVSSALAGFYRAPLTWRATAASRRAVTFSAPALDGTGLSFDVSGGSATLSGIPTTVTSLRNLRVTATAVGSPATASRDSSFAVVPDVFTFGSVPLASRAFIQNKPITPFQVVATTLSERFVTSYTSFTLPNGVTVSTTGVVSGTPLASASGSFTVTGSTGYASAVSSPYSYSLTPDSIVFTLTPDSSTFSPGDPVSIEVNGIAFSGATVSNYAFSNLVPTYGLTIGSQTGTISGNLFDGNPPTNLLPPGIRNFQVRGSAGLLDGSFSMVITTTNPIVDRAFMLAHLPDPPLDPGRLPGLYVSDTNASLSSWSNNFAGLFTSFARKNATLDSNTYVLSGGENELYRSTNGDDWTPAVVSRVGGGPAVFVNDPTLYVVRNRDGTSNWEGVGTFTDDSITYIGYFVSSNDGANWSVVTGNSPTFFPPISTRRSTSVSNYYTLQGLAFASKGSVRLLGGGVGFGATPFPYVYLRSGDSGSNWTSSDSGALTREIAAFNVDASSIWVMAGSDTYAIGGFGAETGVSPFGFPTTTRTLCWSEDEGVQWSNSTGTPPNVGAYEIAYVSNTWLVTGMGRDASGDETGTGSVGDGFPFASTRFVFSLDGKEWSNISLGDIPFSQRSPLALPEIGPLWYDATHWNVILNLQPAPDSTYPRWYRHPINNALATGWTLVTSNITSLTPPGPLTSFDRAFVRTGTPTSVEIRSNTIPGPTLTAPANTSLFFYQYITIEPIVFAATGTGPVFFFVETADLPPGLLFDPITATLSGKSVVLGTESFDIFLKDDVGVTRVTIRTNTILPAVTRPTTTAAAYTSLVRQYTEVNAARNAENNVVYPGESRGIGAFTRPTPPNEITQTVDPTCFSTSNCT